MAKLPALTALILVLSLKSSTAGWFDGIWPWKGCKSVCYEPYGCFTTETPFTNTEGMLPKNPKKVGVKFHLYTRKIRRHPFVIKYNKFNFSTIDTNREFKIIVHGFKDKARKIWVRRMVRALLKRDDMNVIAVDWKKGANTLNYLQAVANSRLVGRIIAHFLQQLKSIKGLNETKVHIIGHSLGAHIAGYVGQKITHIGRISGLDPAGPAFDGTDPEVRLDPTDALFVDVIHTDGEKLMNLDLQPGFGTKQRMGSVDFFPNGGVDQPGCPLTLNQQIKLLFKGNIDVVENFGCSHLRAFRLFTESINSACPFTSFPCHQGHHVIPGCDSCGNNGCARMGYHANIGNPRGVFVLNTSDSSPYCIE